MDKILFRTSIATNKGIRPNNEDASWVGTNESNQLLMIVCDGIGSQDDSQIASVVAVETFQKAFSKKKRIFNIDYFFLRNLKKAYTKITNLSNQKLGGKKIGTTLVLAFVNQDKVTVYNLGDSRLYHYSYMKNEWYQITQDHNLYNYLIQMTETNKKLDINQLTNKYKSQLLSLTKCLENGNATYREYDKFVFNIKLGDVLFAGSDGAYHYLKLADINETIKNNQNNFALISKKLIDIALQNQSNDNLTVVLAETSNVNSQ